MVETSERLKAELIEDLRAVPGGVVVTVRVGLTWVDFVVLSKQDMNIEIYITVNKQFRFGFDEKSAVVFDPDGTSERDAASCGFVLFSGLTVASAAVEERGFELRFEGGAYLAVDIGPGEFECVHVVVWSKSAGQMNMLGFHVI